MARALGVGLNPSLGSFRKGILGLCRACSCEERGKRDVVLGCALCLGVRRAGGFGVAVERGERRQLETGSPDGGPWVGAAARWPTMVSSPDYNVP